MALWLPLAPGADPCHDFTLSRSAGGAIKLVIPPRKGQRQPIAGYNLEAGITSDLRPF